MQLGHARRGAGRRVALGLAASALAVAAEARAVDTVETWDVGATDVDFCLGYDGPGRARADRRVAGEIMLGHGLVERLSAHLGAALSADESLGSASSEVFLGIFGTPVETPHFDLDLFLDLATSHAGDVALTVTPALELNGDLDPEMRSFGAFLRVGLPLTGRAVEGEEARTEVAVAVEAGVGAYLTLAARHQLLLSYDMTFRPDPADGEASVEVGGLALGYNVCVHEAIELVTEARLDLPQGDEPVAAGFVLGFTATLPSARAPETAGASEASGLEPAEAVEGDGAGDDRGGLDPEHERTE